MPLAIGVSSAAVQLLAETRTLAKRYSLPSIVEQGRGYRHRDRAAELFFQRAPQLDVIFSLTREYYLRAKKYPAIVSWKEKNGKESSSTSSLIYQIRIHNSKDFVRASKIHDSYYDKISENFNSLSVRI